ncbi:hypothetical protein GWO18_05445 [Candidatus Bathyarchaeota archaeon]|nr:hypothetical protein [Candidatus Bathyarchaeota archaeon]
MRTLSGTKHCSPTCEAFKCAKEAAGRRGDVVWCEWTDEECQVAKCNFAMCVKRRLLPDGVCGETLKRKTAEKGPEEMEMPVKLRARVKKKLRNDLF